MCIIIDNIIIIKSRLKGGRVYIPMVNTVEKVT